MNQLFTLKQYLKYILRAKNLHGVHSPFVYEFNQQVVNDTRTFYAFEQIEKMRLQLLRDTKLLNIVDYGAGSTQTNAAPQKKVCDIATSAARRKKYGELLFRIQNAHQYQNVLELGTSLGVGLAYLATAFTSATVHTIEGCPDISHYAQQQLKHLQINNVHYHIGEFGQQLKSVLQLMPEIDCVVIDGNHRYEATLEYFKLLWPHMSSSSVIVFDDIYWSPGMFKAWQHIQQHNDVFITVDLFQFGLVFKRKEFTTKQHFTLRY